MTRYNKGDRVREDTPAYPLGTVVWSTDEDVSVHWDGDSYAEEVSATSGRILLAKACAVELNVGDKVHKRGGRDGVVIAAGPLRSAVRFDHNKFVAGVENERLVLLEKASKPKPPSWSDVEKGDLVEFESLITSEVIKTTAHHDSAGICILGYSKFSGWLRKNTRLVSITKPTPPLPTKPGVAIAVPGYTGLLHRRRLHSVHGKVKAWVSDGGTFYTDEEIQRMGWEVAS